MELELKGRVVSGNEDEINKIIDRFITALENENLKFCGTIQQIEEEK